MSLASRVRRKGWGWVMAGSRPVRVEATASAASWRAITGVSWRGRKSRSGIRVGHRAAESRSLAASGPSVRPAHPIAPPFEVLLDLAPLPVRSEQPAQTEHANARHEDDEPGAEHRPVEPQAGRIVQHVDREPHEAEQQADADE